MGLKQSTVQIPPLLAVEMLRLRSGRSRAYSRTLLVGTVSTRNPAHMFWGGEKGVDPSQPWDTQASPDPN